MYDIEKELKGLKPINHTPTEAFRQQTLAMLRNKTQKKRNLRKLVFSLSAAVVMAFALLVVMLPLVNSVSYYTVDINPSIQFTVNSNNTVTDVSSANDDADTLLDGTELEGMTIKVALQRVIELAYTQEYLAPGGHVLVAHFGSDEGISDLELKDIVDDITPGINVLLINGEKSSYKEAQKQDMQAGIYLLKEQATDIGIVETDVDNLITLMCSEKGNKVSDGKGNSGSNGNAADSVDMDKEVEHSSNSENAHSKNEEDKPDKDEKQDKEDKPEKEDKPDKNDKPDKDEKQDKEDKPNNNNGNGKNNSDEYSHEDDDSDEDENSDEDYDQDEDSDDDDEDENDDEDSDDQGDDEVDDKKHDNEDYNDDDDED